MFGAQPFENILVSLALLGLELKPVHIAAGMKLTGDFAGQLQQLAKSRS